MITEEWHNYKNEVLSNCQSIDSWLFLVTVAAKCQTYWPRLSKIAIILSIFKAENAIVVHSFSFLSRIRIYPEIAWCQQIQTNLCLNSNSYERCKYDEAGAQRIRSANGMPKHLLQQLTVQNR